MIERHQDEYEVISEDGEWCAASSSLEDARHYALIYSQDHPVKIVWVRRMVVEEYAHFSGVSMFTKED